MTFPGKNTLLLLLSFVVLPAFRETVLTQPAKPANLFGTMTVPDRARTASVLIIPGGTDRDGNRPGQHNDSLKRLAHGLAACGIASLRIDPRGYGDSTQAVPWEADSFTPDLTDADARTWLARLGQGAAAIGVGEGSLTALRLRAARLVLLEAPSQPPGEVLRRRIGQLCLSADAQTRMNAAIDDLEAGRPATDMPPAVGHLLHFGQTYLMSLFQRDPMAELRRNPAPTLVITGTTDLELMPEDGRTLASARAGVGYESIPFMNHVLRDAPAAFGINLGTYEHPELRLHPMLLPALCRFLGGATAPAGTG
jgi:pimeloyl-ACP methyl ester carboxylesterase